MNDVASMAIKTAFRRGKTKAQEVHRWITAVLLREMTGLDGHATLDNAESNVQFTRCIRQGSVETRGRCPNGNADSVQR